MLFRSGEIFRAGCAWIRLRDGALEDGWEFDANNPPPLASLAAVAGHLATLAGARNAAPEHPGYSM